MKWFINTVFTYAPLNNKAAEFGCWVNQWKYTLFASNSDKDRFITELRSRIHQLNEYYNNTKPFLVSVSTGDGVRLVVSVSGHPDKIVCYLDIVSVRKEVSHD